MIPIENFLSFYFYRQIFEEAYRIIPSGGAISIMDINPRSAFFQKFAANPFAFAAFKRLLLFLIL
jgi:hypothetical protein